MQLEHFRWAEPESDKYRQAPCHSTLDPWLVDEQHVQFVEVATRTNNFLGSVANAYSWSWDASPLYLSIWHHNSSVFENGNVPTVLQAGLLFSTHAELGSGGGRES
jgi:hypothetical protein